MPSKKNFWRRSQTSSGSQPWSRATLFISIFSPGLKAGGTTSVAGGTASLVHCSGRGEQLPSGGTSSTFARAGAASAAKSNTLVAIRRIGLFSTRVSVEVARDEARAEVARALATGRDVPLHARDGEGRGARILALDADEGRLAVSTSARPGSQPVRRTTA